MGMIEYTGKLLTAFLFFLRGSISGLVSVPDPTHYARMTFEGFLGCAHPHVLIQQARDLHVPIHFVYKIFTVSACREPVYVCVASLFSVLLINCQRNQISRSDQGRSDNGVYACANHTYNKSVHYT